MTDLRKPKVWTEEERQNVVNVFSWLLKEDRKQNPENYNKPKKENDNTSRVQR
jgi:hypothetical protein